MNILWDSGNIGFGGCGINEWDRNVISELRKNGHQVTVLIDQNLEKRPKYHTWIPPEGGFTYVPHKITPFNYREIVDSLGKFDVQIGNHFTMFPVCDKVLPVVHDVEIAGREAYSLSVVLTLKGLGTRYKTFACTTKFIEDQVKGLLGEDVRTQCLYSGCKFSGKEPGVPDEGRPYIAYWGNRYAEGKNFLALIKSMQHHDLDLRVCSFLGVTPKETDLIAKLGLENRITFYQSLPDDELYSVIQGSSLYVCPSKYEGMGMPAMEAMSIGIPVVVSPCGALPSIVQGAGYIAKSASPKDLAAAIHDCLRNPRQTETYIKEGFKRSTQWTWDNTVKGLENLAHSVVYN